MPKSHSALVFGDSKIEEDRKRIIARIHTQSTCVYPTLDCHSIQFVLSVRMLRPMTLYYLHIANVSKVKVTVSWFV